MGKCGVIPHCLYHDSLTVIPISVELTNALNYFQMHNRPNYVFKTLFKASRMTSYYSLVFILNDGINCS